MSLDNQEKEILEVLAKHNPFSFNEIEFIYLKLKSYDNTINAMEIAQTFNRSLNDVCEIVSKAASLIK